ncbi:tRNA-guanine(15) transglycosylase-like protein [Sporodiniella umbellata]|nr:tRNA-guanine(15) transglycosylase-like protein [Sporodiniella umbellata]
MKLQFELKELPNNARRGTLQFIEKNKTIQTPNCLTYSLRGSVPHLVADNLSPLPIELIQVSLEQLLEHKDTSSFKYPHGLHKYLHHEDKLLFCDLRDPLKLVPTSFNTDKYLSVESHGGVRQVTPELWAEAMKSYQPDLVAPMVDTITDLDAKPKRIIRSVNRSLRWLDDNLAQAKTLDIPLFAHVMGHTHAEERIRSAKETAQRDVEGFIINLLGLDREQTMALLRVSTDALPANKPRLCYGLATPEKILEGISNGIDLFDGSYAYKATEKGRAIVFRLGCEEAKESVPKTLDLWDPIFAHDFSALDPECGCHSCSRPHNRAFIHHLLNAHEMLGPLLIMSHNIYQLDRFMRDIRDSIDDNTFEQKKDIFMKHYSHAVELDGKKSHVDEVDNESLGVPLKKKRTIL